MLVLLTAVITFLVTSITMYNQNKNNNKSTIVSQDEISRTFQIFRKYINQKYIGEINDEKMLESAIKGYVSGLEDEYSEYITSDEMEEYMEDTVGKYVGIGVYIVNNTETDQIEVLMPIKGSPAEEVGILPGDIITKIDGVEYKGSQLSDASEVLKQQEGTKVNVEILRNDETIVLEVERRKIKVNHVESKIIEENIGYIEVSTFDEGTYDEFEKAWNELKEKNVASLIIDLRNNGGGIVQEALGIADLMIEKDKTMLITTGKNGEEVNKANKEKIIDLPIVILINDKSASSSEILAAAVKENNENVTLVGTTTYGKGVIQTIFRLYDGSGLKLTTNEYYTPNRNSINKIGIKPDEEVTLPEGKTVYTIEENEDTQLQKAIEILK
ncbi:MAG: S41 family peptidase [Clostridia bacterium]|nr:S41 family peptidase [Clostridia bacterium]